MELATQDRQETAAPDRQETAALQVHSTPEHKTGFRKLLGLSSMIMALALPIGVYPRVMQSRDLDLTQEKTAQQLPAVSVAQVSPAVPTRKITLPGTVEAIVETPIYARTSGYIRSSLVDIGDRVSSGQVLADIETPELDEGVKETRALVLTNIATKAQMQANLDKAKADLETAVADLAQARANLLERQSAEQFAYTSSLRWKSLVAQGAVSRQDADDKDTALKTSNAATAAAEQKVHSLESQIIAARAQVNAQLANVNVGDANIDAARARQNRSNTEQAFNKVVAPFAGVITERNIDRGALITSGSENSKVALYHLARIDTVKVFVDVPQYASVGIKVGQPVSITLKELPGRTFTGKIERTSVALDANARTLKTEIHVSNRDLLLAPGMYADVSFSVPRPAHTFLIPTNALLTRAEGPSVVIASNDTVHMRNVQIGDDLGKQVEIVGGLTNSEKVVLNPNDSLIDGARVRIEKN